ncbi:MAG: ferritin-like domain-containing protein [Weeksellaceae bacterium]
MKLSTMHDLLIHQLQDLYSAEQQIIEALPKMQKTASSKALQDAFAKHLEETETHVKRLEEVGDELDIKLGGITCKGMEGLIKESEELLEMDKSPIVDQALIAAAQRVEHYEIAGYGCVLTYAEMLGHDDIVDTLKDTMDEEITTDEDLTTIAEDDLEAMEDEE